MLAWLLVGACAPSQAGTGTEPDPVAATVAEAAGAALPRPIPVAEDLGDLRIWVGSPSQADPSTATDAILAEATVQVLEAAGADVVDRTDLGAGILVRDSLLSGEIDLAWEGTGRAWTALLRQPADGLSATDIAERLAERDLAENRIAWLPPAPVQVGPRFAVATGLADREGIDTMSAMGAVLSGTSEGALDGDVGGDAPLGAGGDGDEGAPVVTCVTSNFVTFPSDGRLAVEEALDVTLPEEDLRVYEPEPIYPATGEQECTFGLVDPTSGRIARYGLTVLEDDVGAFLPNQPAPAVRADVIEDHPEIAALLAGLAAALTPEVIQELNREIVLDGATPTEAVARWLAAEGHTVAARDADR